MALLRLFYLALLTGFLALPALHGQVIYKGGQTLITGTWQGNGTLVETSANQPYEGSQHYGFTYNITNYWAGYGLNLDNWYTGAGVNFSGYSHLRLAYRGLSGDHTVSVRLRQGQNTYGPDYQIGGATGTYQVIDIPLTALTGASGINLSAISEIDISVTAPTGTGNGAVYVDALELVNLAPPPASVAWPRANAMGLGLNLANWLEAYWLMPYNAYPETNRYTRADMVFFKNAGFNTIRMPVTFERLALTTPPYTLNVNQPAFVIIDTVIAWANDLNMKLIIDNHHGYELTNSNYQAQIPRLQAIWQQIMAKYGGLNPEKVFFELYNEPTNTISNANFRTVAEAVITTIRATSTTHTLIVGGNGWNGADGLTGLTPYYDANIIYTFHNYDPYFFTHQGLSFTGLPSGVPFPQSGDMANLAATFQSVKNWSNQYNMPVFLGEYGCSSVADAASRCNWINAISAQVQLHNFSSAYWGLKFFTDDFGFFTSTPPSAGNVVPCFATALQLNLTPLAIEFVSAYTRCDGQVSEVIWSAHVTDENTTFELEQSADGLGWQTVGSIPARSGLQEYRYADIAATGDGFYRLVYLAPDGAARYSPIVPAQCGKKNSLQFFPNPAVDYVTATLQTEGAQTGQISLYDARGGLLRTESLELASGTNAKRFELADLPAGFYNVIWQDEQGQVVATGKVVKQ